MGPHWEPKSMTLSNAFQGLYSKFANAYVIVEYIYKATPDKWD